MRRTSWSCACAPASRALRLGRRLSTTTARPLRPFLVERYAGWTDGSDSLASSEIEPLGLHELLAYADDEAAERWRTLSLGYPSHNEGSPFLRREIAATYAGCTGASGLDAERHINVCAPQEGIYLAARAMLKPGDHVVATVPHYQSLSEVARSMGCEVSGWRPEASELELGQPTLRFNPAALHSLLRPGRTKLVIANWPHNPTGALPTPAELQAIVDACVSCGAHLMVDEMYRGLEHEGAKQLAAAVEAYEHGVSLGGLSKTVGLPGLRIGWLASRDAALMARVAQLKDYTTICPAAPSEVLGLIALRAAAPLLRRSRAILAVGLQGARELVRAHPEHLAWSEPQAGTFAFVRLQRADGGLVDSEAYCEKLRARANLMLLPGALFDLDDGRDGGGSGGLDAAQCVRLTFGRQGMAPLMQRWSDDLRKHGLCPT